MMRVKLNLWQTLLLFLPFAVSEIFLRLSYSGGLDHRIDFAVANLLLTFNVALIICYQTYLVAGFIKASGVKAVFLKVNAFVPAIFTVYYFLSAIWGTAITHSYNARGYNTGPLRQSQLHGSALVITLFLLHAFITFYFVNNQFVSRMIKKIAGEELRNELMHCFLAPLKLLTKISIYVIGCSLLVSTILDMLSYAKLSK
jgi:hypothetical protein